MSEESFDCGWFVTQRIAQLLGKDPGNLSSVSRALLAQLRQAENKEPGTVPGVWAITAEGIPDDLPRSTLERAEQAIHIALTQFAVHQQSRSSSMHTPNRSFGRAVRALAQISNADEPYESPVYRRFTAMSTATSLAGLLAHSRGIITQLRSAEIGFDYGGYAKDLYHFQIPAYAGAVRRRWGREFHRLPAIAETMTDNENQGA